MLAACSFICATSAGVGSSLLSKKPLMSGVLPSSDVSDASIVHVPPGDAVHRAHVRPVNVRLHRPASPALAARRQLHVDAAFRRRAAEQRVGFLHEVGMIREELPQADVHALFVALGHARSGSPAACPSPPSATGWRSSSAISPPLELLAPRPMITRDALRRDRRLRRPRPALRTAARSSCPAASPASLSCHPRSRASSARPRRISRTRPDCPGCRTP